ncbi:MAG: PIN domain-containing protein [Alphaproteobacteria bacterium]|nr:PIN domain-containing protein [Alphaproteobacteria bacterium]
MTVGNRFAIDANVLVYAIDVDAGAKRRLAESLLIDAARVDAWLTVQSLAEFFHAVTRKRIATIENATRYVQTWQIVFNVTAADVQSIDDAMAAVRDHSLSFWDAMQWATARQAGCTCLITEDMQHGQRIGGVELINPFLP